jgi:hypothetical protein
MQIWRYCRFAVASFANSIHFLSTEMEGRVVSSDEPKVTTTLPGKVEKVIAPHPHSGEPEKAQIAVEGADHLYREIRVPNRLIDDKGRKVRLKEGADVDVKIEADPVVTNAVPTEESAPPLRRSPL